MLQREKTYADRERKGQETCKEYAELKERQIPGKSFSFDMRYNLAVCMNAKVRASLTYFCKHLWKDPIEGWIHCLDEEHFVTL